VAEPAAIRYRAFMSYSHRDTTSAKWLHKALEGYRIGKDLVGRETPAGPVPKTLRPIFRDREDFSGGSTLTAATVAALDASAALVVLCSMFSASRPAVNEEVRLFRSRHPDRPVIPVIIDGTPPDNFPPALRYELAADGTITDHPVTVLGPDLRDSGDGKSLGLAKVIAGLIGIGTDEVFRRAERARKRRNRFWGALAAVFLVLALAASASALYAWQQLKTNEAFLNATLKSATEIVNEAVQQAEKYNVPRAATLALLDKAEGLFDDMARYGRPTPELRYRKAWMLIEFARNYKILGDTDKQSARANEAHRLLAGLAAEKPDNITYQRDVSVAFNEVGDVLVAQGNLTEALKSYRDTLTIMERLAKADANNAGWQRDLAVSYNKVGDVLVDQGNLTEALKSYRDSLTIMERLAKADANNAGWQRDLAVSYEKVGDVLVAQGNLTEALKSYRDSLTIRERLAKADANNAGWQRDLAVSYGKVGDVLVAQGNLTEALKSYRDSLTIMERLAKADANNAGWQRDLAVSYNEVGDVLVDQGNLTEALKSYRDSLTIAERLAKADPNNAGWQRDLAISNERLGDIYMQRKETAEAKAAFERALAIYDKLTAKFPNDTPALVNSTVPLIRLGELYGPEGRAYFQKALAILKQLDETGRLEPNRKPAITWIERRLAELQEEHSPEADLRSAR
jgi:tetratricopeptide (TPR) repeat protein